MVSIPFELGDVFRPENEATRTVRIQSQSLSSRAMSFDYSFPPMMYACSKSQSLSSRAMSFDKEWLDNIDADDLSQSLSSRAMSFDCKNNSIT